MLCHCHHLHYCAAAAVSIKTMHHHHQKLSIPPETHMEHTQHLCRHLGRHSHPLIDRSHLSSLLITTTSPAPTELRVKAFTPFTLLIQKISNHYIVLARLHKEQNLTLTFNGNGTHQSDSIYFVHVTTKNHESYFLNSYEGSEEHHTVQWGRTRFSRFFLLCYYSLYHHNWLRPQFIDSGKCQWRLIVHDVLW
jgi:hypothetical protein